MPRHFSRNITLKTHGEACLAARLEARGRNAGFQAADPERLVGSEVCEHEQADRAGQIGRQALPHHRINKLAHVQALLLGNLLEGLPKFILKADACLAPAHDDRPFGNFRRHDMNWPRFQRRYSRVSC